MWAKMNQLDALARIISPKKLGNSKFLDLRLKKASLSKDSKIFAKCNMISWHSLKAVNDMVNDKNALSVNHTQLNLAESKSHSGIRAECILHMAVSIGVID